MAAIVGCKVVNLAGKLEISNFASDSMIYITPDA